MGDSGADVVDQLFFNQLLAIPDAVEDFTDGNGRHGVLANQAEARLVLCRGRIFHPEQAILFDAFTKASRFNGRQPMMHVVKEMFTETELAAHCVEQFGREVEVFLGGPQLLFRPLALGRRLVRLAFPLRHSIGRFHTRNAALHANGLKAHLLVAGIVLQYFIDGVPGGVAVNHHAFSRCTAQQLIQRHPRRFRFYIPQRHIDGRNSRHGDRPTAPVRSFVEKLPDVFNAVRIAANKLRTEMILQIRCHGELTSVQRRIPQPDNPVIGGDFKGDKVTSGASDENFSGNDLHLCFLPF